MSFLPEDFEVPQLLETPSFRIRALTTHDVLKSYEAVMTNREHLWELFGEAWGWPPEDLTLEQELIDLGGHQKEFQLHSSFDYAVMSPDEKRLLGCFYVDPPEKQGFDAEIYFWARTDLSNDYEGELSEAVREFVASKWPFGKVVYPGRDITWEEYDTLPTRYKLTE